MESRFAGCRLLGVGVMAAAADAISCFVQVCTGWDSLMVLCWGAKGKLPYESDNAGA